MSSCTGKFTLTNKLFIYSNDIFQKNEILEEGDYLRCVLIGIQNENLLASTDQDELKRIDPLLSLKITLGSIERRDFPVHYDHVSVIFCNSRRSIQEYKSLKVY